MRIINIPTWLLTLATLAPTGCALPDDGAEIAFRSSYGAAEAGDVNAGGQDGPIIEVPECIVVTTPTSNADDGEGPPGSTTLVGGDDFNHPGDDSTTTGASTGTTVADDDGDDRAPPPDGDEGDGGDERGAPYEGGDDLSGVPTDPTGIALCPGEGKKVTIQATSALSAARLCEQHYGHCCDAVCDEWNLEPNDSCALAPDDEQIDGLLDVNPNPGTYACGCDCIQGLVINGT